MTPSEGGVFECLAPGVHEGADYYLRIDNVRACPDPVSRSQPFGVHGPSRVVSPYGFSWSDPSWRGLPQNELVFYEIHVGSFTPLGTFDAVIPKLPYLSDLGINAIELMPVASFPGTRNWGYDGVHLYAPQCSYGGPNGLKRLVDAAHRLGIGVFLDVVYNHLGPEGNYLSNFAPFQTHKYQTPWGGALNFDGPHSDGVRRYVVQNALFWLSEYHIDGLRIDAIHNMIDLSPRHVLDEISEAFHQQAEHLGKSAWIIAESNLNDIRVLKPTGQGGYGLDALWNDDFHYALFSLLTGFRRRQCQDFGTFDDLVKAISEGFVNDGRYSSYRKRRHGTSSRHFDGSRLVAYIQNHDQVANTSRGSRLSALLSLAQQKVAACLLLCCPALPLLFMGQEYGETSPFHYFIDHSDPSLASAVGEGRRLDFPRSDGDPDLPDPSDPQARNQSSLRWSRLSEEPHSFLLSFYRVLLALRKQLPSLHNGDKARTSVCCDSHQHWLSMRRGDHHAECVAVLANLSDLTQLVPLPHAVASSWLLRLWTENPLFGGSRNHSAPHQTMAQSQSVALPPWSAAIYSAQPFLLLPPSRTLPLQPCANRKGH